MKIEQLISQWSIGWSDANPKTRNVGWGLPQHNWQWFVDSAVMPVIKKGFKRIELHNPFGCLADEPMMASQFIAAQTAQLDFLTNGFQKAFRPLTEKGIEVIAYMGSPNLDPTFLNLKDVKFAKDEYLKRLYDSYHTVLDAGCSIGFDALSAISGENDPAYKFARLVQSLGVKIYTEAWPPNNMPFMADMNELTGSSFHQNVMENDWKIPVEKMTGEKIQLLNHVPFDGESWGTYFQWCPKWVQDTVRTYGETPCFNVPTEFTNSKLTIEQWLGKFE